MKKLKDFGEMPEPLRDYLKALRFVENIKNYKVAFVLCDINEKRE